MENLFLATRTYFIHSDYFFYIFTRPQSNDKDWEIMYRTKLPGISSYDKYNWNPPANMPQPEYNFDLVVNFTDTDIRIYVNQELVTVHTDFHDALEGPPTFTSVINAEYSTGSGSPPESCFLSLNQEQGVIDILKWIKGGKGTSSVEASHFSSEGLPGQSLKNHFTHLQVYKDDTEGDTVYEPAQAKNHCYRYNIDHVLA